MENRQEYTCKRIQKGTVRKAIAGNGDQSLSTGGPRIPKWSR